MDVGCRAQRVLIRLCFAGSPVCRLCFPPVSAPSQALFCPPGSHTLNVLQGSGAHFAHLSHVRFRSPAWVWAVS